MKVVACLNAQRGAASETVLAPDDAQALALALSLDGNPSVTAVLAGLVADEAPLRRALAAGATRAVRVVGEALDTADFHTLGQALAMAVKRVGADLVLAPARSQKDGLDATPAALARQMGASYVACVEAIAAAKTDDGALAVDITVRGGGRVRRLRIPLPAVLSVIASGPTAPELPNKSDVPGSIEVVSLVDPEATVVRRRTELLGQPELATRPTQTVDSAKALVAALSR